MKSPGAALAAVIVVLFEDRIPPGSNLQDLVLSRRSEGRIEGREGRLPRILSKSIIYQPPSLPPKEEVGQPPRERRDRGEVSEERERESAAKWNENAAEGGRRRKKGRRRRSDFVDSRNEGRWREEKKNDKGIEGKKWSFVAFSMPR